MGSASPAWERACVGDVLLAHTIPSALEDGIDENRFGRGDEPDKYPTRRRTAGFARSLSVGV